MNKKNNIKHIPNSKNKKKRNLNDQNYNKKKNEDLPLLQEENKKENRYKSERKIFHRFKSNNKTTKKNIDMLAIHPPNSKLFLKNKEDVKPRENSFLKTFNNNLRQQISNKNGRVSSANKIFKFKRDDEYMNIQESKKKSTKRIEDELNNKEDEKYNKKDLLKEIINAKENQEVQLLKGKLSENEKGNIELKENQEKNKSLNKENTTREQNEKEEKDIVFMKDILSPKFRVNTNNSKVLFQEEIKKNINQSMDYGKSKNPKNTINLENGLDNQKDSKPIISNSKEKNFHDIVNKSNKHTQIKKDGLKKNNYNGSTWNMQVYKDNNKRFKLREKSANLIGQKKR